jgi:Zn-dependent peptidase ImmA (M78 family)
MVISNNSGSKERLFDIMRKVNNLNEAVLPHSKKVTVVDKFIEYAQVKLELGEDPPSVTLITDDGAAEAMKSFGRFTPQNKEIHVVSANRNLADVLRTIGHELVHYKQGLEGRINKDSGETGSDEENEANAEAGVLMREFGRNNPIIFE